MSDLWRCKVCDSFLTRDRIDGRCCTCGKLTCYNCKRTCDGCTRIFCMRDVRARKILRGQEPFTYTLCEGCSKWW